MQEVTRLSTVAPIFNVQKRRIRKNGRKAQLERVMHKRARGHRFEPCNSHFLCPKTKNKKKPGERRSWKESCTNVQEVTMFEPCNSHFFMSKNKQKQNKGERPSWESHAQTCKRSRCSSPVTPIFYVQKRKIQKQERLCV